jgi:acetolactate synthase-1/2/3 large subunit
MNGAEAMLRTLVGGGVEVCFTNPGTSEMQFVAAADRVPGLRCVLGLFEGVVSGAADGYARMTDRPAATLLHLGPGLANGLANFHNAMRARVPIVSIVGDHATYHRTYDSPLSSEVADYAKPVSGWIRDASTPERLAADTMDTIVAARQPPGRIATLIVPADCTWSSAPGPVAPPPAWPTFSNATEEALSEATAALEGGEPCALLMTGRALRASALTLAGRIAAATRARLLCDTLNTRLERGAGRVTPERLPYFPEQVLAMLTGLRHLILIGSKPPVGFFAYPNHPSWLTPENCRIHTLAHPHENPLEALERLAERLGADGHAPLLQPRVRPALPSGELTPQSMALTLGALIPEGAIVSEEAATGGFGLLPATAGAPPHDWLFLTGGAIGQGLPVAVGAAVACPDRKVLALQADGGGMYTVQALWTMAREGLDVTTVVYANRAYRILQVEHERVGAGRPGAKALAMMDLRRPDLDWVRLAEGMGVPARRATTLEEFNRALRAYLAEPGPNLIEAVV